MQTAGQTRVSQAPEEQDAHISLRDIVAPLRRRKRVLLGSFAALFVLLAILSL